MRTSDGVVWVGVVLRTANDVTPPCTDTSTSGDVDDVVILVGDTLVTSEGAIAHAHDGLEKSVSIELDMGPW